MYLRINNSILCFYKIIFMVVFQELKNESENLKTKGNGLFRDGNYTAAASIYTEALKMCPLIFEKERAILYANRAASKVKFMVIFLFIDF